jgi:hypothetical protein
MRDSFLDTELSKLGGNKDCVWNWAFAYGHSGGILLGIK